ncbi:aminotransferase class I/II-fold pyridoxal phosphate-dependent enzyme [Thermoproteus uzoniensis]|uniref:aminotransferase class I/II-fold pyridoxal phosphate-dependent enzyme n=1 Tax=Thermoproteus uzoniensis TaxID=184117 RepID=UPI00069A4AFB|nr:aminotransferase class I/II-fold pyridoxal phosphate-dependent enzyme [Thermoproteus uzoniensis]
MHGGTSWAEPAVLDFSDNLNPIGPPPGLPELVAEAAERGVYLRFPANLAEEVLAQYEGIEVVLFNGATEALTAMIAALRPKRLLLPWPTYSDYVRIAGLLGLEVVRGDLSSLVGRAASGDLLLLCNPNNPTGSVMGRDEVLELGRALEARGARLLVDESFLDFVREESAAPDVPVVKSYGKILAAPGLRLGAALGRVRPDVKSPWRVNSLADYAIYNIGAEALKRHREATREYVAAEGPRVQEALSRCVEVVKSRLHFFIVRGWTDKVKVRPLDDLGMPGYSRVSIKRREEDDLLIRALCGA